MSYFQKFKGSKIYIYGAGYDGTLLHHIFEVNNIKIESFIVDKEYKYDDFYRGVKIVTIDEFELKDKKSIVFIAMNANPLKELSIQKISEIFFDKFIDCNKEMLNYMLSLNSNCFLKKYSINIEEEFLNFKTYDNHNVTIVNPYKINSSFVEAFNLELPDLVIPVIDENFNFTNEGKYEVDKVKINKGDVVIDCGANIGIFSSIALSKGAKVFAFEPVISLNKYLNKLKNIYPNFEVINLALSDSNGKIFFRESLENATSHSIIHKNDLKTNQSEHKIQEDLIFEVDTITLDEFVLKNNITKIDFIKADIEGAERLLLTGATDVLKKFAPKLSICTYHHKDDKEILEKIVKNSNPNYKIFHKWKKMYAYI